MVTHSERDIGWVNPILQTSHFANVPICKHASLQTFLRQMRGMNGQPEDKGHFGANSISRECDQENQMNNIYNLYLENILKGVSFQQ